MGELVDILAVTAEFLPPHAEAADDAAAHLVAHHRLADDAAALVEDAHALPGHDAARGGVAGGHLEHRLAFAAAQAGHVDEGGVEEVARRRRDHGQRKAGRELRHARRRFVVGHVVGHAEAGRIDQALAARSREAALSERSLGDGELHVAVLAQGVEIDAAVALRVVGGARQGLVAVGEAGVVEAHLRGELAEDAGIGARFAKRRDRRLVDERIGMPVAHVHVEVLELGRRRQHVVGEVGGVGHEVLEHHGEEIAAREAACDLRRIGGHRDRVAVVDHDGLDLRAEAAAVGQGLPALAQQLVADGAHVDHARQRAAGSREEVRPLQGRVVPR